MNVSMILQDAFARFSSAYPDLVEAFEEVQVKSLQEEQARADFEILQSLNECEEPRRRKNVVTTLSLEFSGAAKHYTSQLPARGWRKPPAPSSLFATPQKDMLGFKASLRIDGVK